MNNQNEIILVEIEPKEILYFDIYPKELKSTSCLLIKNKSTFEVTFKVKTSTNSFLISPEESLLKPNSQMNVKLSYNFSETTVNVLHKFLVVVNKCNKAITSQSSPPQYLEFKLWAKFNRIEENSLKSKPGTEDEKSRLREQIERLKGEIEKNKTKLVKSHDTNYLTHEKLGVFGALQLVALFFIGFLIGLIVHYKYFLL